MLLSQNRRVSVLWHTHMMRPPVDAWDCRDPSMTFVSPGVTSDSGSSHSISSSRTILKGHQPPGSEPLRTTWPVDATQFEGWEVGGLEEIRNIERFWGAAG